MPGCFEAVWQGLRVTTAEHAEYAETATAARRWSMENLSIPQDIAVHDVASGLVAFPRIPVIPGLCHDRSTIVRHV